MNKFEKDCIKKSLIKLALLRSTGTPAELAFRFEKSERTIKRLIKELRDEGLDIYYDYNSVSYLIKDYEKHVVKHMPD